MSGYDAWLEKPYVDAARRDADFEAFCEQAGLDMEDEASWDKFEEAMNAESEAEAEYWDDYEDTLEGRLPTEEGK